MTIEQTLKEIKKRCDAASEGPWISDAYYVWKRSMVDPDVWEHMVSDLDKNGSITRARGTGHGLSAEQQSANLNWIAHARTDVPLLLEMVAYLVNVSSNCINSTLGSHAMESHMGALEKIAEKYK